ncbi:MAG: tetratricopeptide repeat protein, partial [Deltaproteobacteria bacterium]|nr:tetratricopeptide repeat protein [Deltaproteobacteria bacterium]
SDAGDDAQGWATATGDRIGTPRYMAPEQRHGGSVGPAADQWAFAVSLWEALHARHPFANEDGTVDEQRLAPSRPASTDVPRALRRVLQRALKPEPGERYGSMHGLLDRLETAGHGRRTVRRLGVVGVGLGAIALAWASAPSSPAPCDPTEHSGEVWNEARRDGLEAALVSTGAPYADRAWTDIRARVDPWMAAWDREYRRVCGARAAASTKADADADLVCLRGELAELDALFDVLAQADRDVLAEADRALEDLPEPRRCAAVGTTFDVDPATLAAHTERMARARAQSRAARHEQAAALAGAAAAEVSEHAVLHREALLSQGRSLFQADALDDSARVLTQAFYDGAAAEDSEIAGKAAVGLLDLAVRRSDVGAAADWERHAQTWGERVVDAGVRRALERDRAMAEASRRSHEGEYDAALVLLERARELDARDPSSPYAARLLNQIGMVHIERSAYPQAARALAEAAALELERLGPDHPRYANALSNVGTVHWYQADLDGAERAYAQTYRIRLAAFGPDHYKTGIAIMNLGLVADSRGEYDEAVPLLERAVTALTAAHGREHPDTALAINNLAVTLSKMGQRERSNAAYREALDIYTLALGPEHPRVATVMGNLATGLAEASRYPEALELHARALPIIERVHGRVHAHYANGLHNIAVIRRTLGDSREAEAHDREVLAIYEQLLGPDHPQLARVLVGLSRDALDAGRVEEATALAVRARSLEPTDAGVRGLAAFCLAQAYRAGGRSETGEFVELLDQAQRDLGRADAAPQLRQLQEFRAAAPP